MRLRTPILWAALLAAPFLGACGVADDARRGGAGSNDGSGAPAGEAAPDGAASKEAGPDGAAPRAVFLGTSLTAGFGLLLDSERYTARLQAMADSAHIPVRIVNAGVSGETSAGGVRRLDWILGEPVDVLFLELGANDGLRGLSPDALEDNLDEIVRRTRAAHPDVEVVIAGMEAPPNLGDEYTRRFRRVFRRVAETHDAVLVPFLLEGVAGVAALNQPDRIHPTAEGHRRIAANVWPVLEPVLRRAAVDAGVGR